MIEVLSPIAARRSRPVPLAARPTDLRGKVLGLLDNGKPNADLLVATIGDILAAQYSLGRVVKCSKREASLGAAGPLPDALRARWVGRCDLVLNAIGD